MKFIFYINFLLNTGIFQTILKLYEIVQYYFIYNANNMLAYTNSI